MLRMGRLRPIREKLIGERIMELKYRICNGHVIDPFQMKDAVETIEIEGRKISVCDPAGKPKFPEIDATGCYVVPGLIDFHTHVYASGCGFGVHPDLFLATGVTTTVDGGTSGCSNFEAFYKSTVIPSHLRIFADLNISSQGQFQLGFPENYTPEYFNESRIAELFEKYKGILVGLKMRFSKETIRNLGIKPFLKMMEIAGRLDLPVVVHTTNPPVPASQIVEHLRPGDIYCHCYQGEGETLVDKNGHVYPEFWEARERGVLFDACNGTFNFNFKVAGAAMKEGFYPDIISSDVSLHSFGMPYYCKNLPFVMSKYLDLGMSMYEVVKAATATPAKQIGMEGRLGTLCSGAIADVTVLRMARRPIVYGDRKEEMRGTVTLIPQMTIKNGEIVFCTNDFWL